MESMSIYRGQRTTDTSCKLAKNEQKPNFTMWRLWTREGAPLVCRNWKRLKRWKEVVPGTTRRLFLESFSSSAPPPQQLLWKTERGKRALSLWMFFGRRVNISNLDLSSWRSVELVSGQSSSEGEYSAQMNGRPQGGCWWCEKLPSGMPKGCYRGHSYRAVAVVPARRPKSVPRGVTKKPALSDEARTARGIV